MTKYQHYGMCTRLLGLTTNPLVALYFACEEYGDVYYKGIEDEEDVKIQEANGVIFFNRKYSVSTNEINIKIISSLSQIDLSNDNTLESILRKLTERQAISKELEERWKLKEHYEEFINIKIDRLNISKLPIESCLHPIIQQRIDEIDQCVKNNVPLATIFLCGSVLEGILSAIAIQKTQLFNTAKSSPKDNKTGSARQFNKWTLKDYIDVAKELGYIDLDVQKFSHVLQNFRNYIHPYQQLHEKFSPNIDTAKLCVQVVKIAINQIGNFKYGNSLN